MNLISSKAGGSFLGLNDKITKKRAERLVRRGESHLAEGSLEKALECSKRALSLHNDLSSAHELMARALMPGDDYVALLSRFHNWLQPESYAEIGVATGRSLALARPDTRAVGIDPMPRIKNRIKSRAKLYPTTSDEFFECYDLLGELGTSRLALAFIDGLHQAEQVLKDFINLERYANRETVILVHDCLPITKAVAAHSRATKFWCGDVWKIIPCLRSYRPDLTIGVIPARPSGLAMIANLDPGSTVLAENLSRIISEFQDQDLDYDCLDSAKDRLPNIVPNEWQQITRMIPFRSSSPAA